MSNLAQKVCLVLILTYGCLTETKPKGGSPSKDTIKAECNKCGFSGQMELCLTPKADDEYPEDTASLKAKECEVPIEKQPCIQNYHEQDILDFTVENPMVTAKSKLLHLSSRVHNEMKESKRSKYRYEHLNNASISCDLVKRKRRAIKVRKFKLLRIKSIPRNQVEDLFHSDKKYLANHQPRRIIKRSAASNNCSISATDGYVCRCVPQAEQDSLYGEEKPSFDDTFEDNPINIGGNLSSIETLQQHPLLQAAEDGALSELVAGLVELLYEVSQAPREHNYSVVVKYGTITKEHNENGLRTYDIEPIEGVYEPTAWNELNVLANTMFGDLINAVTNRQRPSRLRSFLQSRRDMRTQFMNFFNSDDNRKRRQCSGG